MGRVRRIATLTPIVVLVGVIVGLAVGESAATAAIHTGELLALVLVCFCVGTAIERSVYGPGGRDAWRQRELH